MNLRNAHSSDPKPFPHGNTSYCISDARPVGCPYRSSCSTLPLSVHPTFSAVVLQHRVTLNAASLQQKQAGEGGRRHLGDVLGGHHECVFPRFGAQQPLGQADGDDARRAAHAGQVVGDHVTAHLEVVDHHRGQRGGRVEQRAVDHQNVDVTRRQACECNDPIVKGFLMTMKTKGPAALESWRRSVGAWYAASCIAVTQCRCMWKLKQGGCSGHKVNSFGPLCCIPDKGTLPTCISMH